MLRGLTIPYIYQYPSRAPYMEGTNYIQHEAKPVLNCIKDILHTNFVAITMTSVECTC